MSLNNLSSQVHLSVTSVFLVLALTLPGSATAGSQKEQERLKKEAELDHACEMARTEALAPMRRKIFAECMAKRNDKAYCFNDAKSYDGTRQGSKPRFYDLPECVRAFAYKKAHRERY